MSYSIIFIEITFYPAGSILLLIIIIIHMTLAPELDRQGDSLITSSHQRHDLAEAEMKERCTFMVPVRGNPLPMIVCPELET